MRGLTAFGALVVGLAVLSTASPAFAVSNRSPSGHYYRPGEFCPKADLGKTIHDPYGTLKCVMEHGSPHWKKVGP
ncbi:MAG TPA: hypothetical protein VME46_10040 [Acidimicrobiales bacterium]|nr:hypothetical protein [Acidimicrobiales bacterium]